MVPGKSAKIERSQDLDQDTEIFLHNRRKEEGEAASFDSSFLKYPASA